MAFVGLCVVKTKTKINHLYKNTTSNLKFCLLTCASPPPPQHTHTHTITSCVCVYNVQGVQFDYMVIIFEILMETFSSSFKKSVVQNG